MLDWPARITTLRISKKGPPMGAWGTGNFDNDVALDFLSALYPREDGCELIERALETVLADDDSYLGSHACSQALAAAEVVAALGGAPREWLSESLSDWVWYRRPVAEDRLVALAELAANAVRQVRDDSELRELWMETDSADEWLVAVDDVAARLDEVPVDGVEAASEAEKFGGEWDVDTALDLERCVGPVRDLMVDHVVFDTADEVLYVTSDYALTAIEMTTGKPLWESYDAARPLMILGDVLLAQDRPARLPFKNLHLALLDRTTGQPLEKFKARFDELLLGDFDDDSGYLRCQAARLDGKLYVSWESGIYPPVEERSSSAFADMKRSRGALCFDPDAKKLRIIDHDAIPRRPAEPVDYPAVDDVADLDPSTLLGGPYPLDGEVIAINRVSRRLARTPEAPRRTGHGSDTGAIVVQRWDDRTADPLESATLLHHAGADIAVGVSFDGDYIWIREQDPAATPACSHHIFDVRTYDEVACPRVDADIGTLQTRLGDFFIFGRYDHVIHAVDANTGDVLWRHSLR